MNYLFDPLIFILCTAIAGALFAMLADLIGIILSKVFPFLNAFFRFIFPFPLRTFLSLIIYFISIHHLYLKIWIAPLICYNIYNFSMVFFLYFTNYPNTENFEAMMSKTTINIPDHTERLRIAKLRTIASFLVSAIFLYQIINSSNYYLIKL